MKTNTQIKYLALTGLFAAMIFVVTAYLHIPTNAGYTHVGDGLIFLSASILPTPYAAAAAAIGGGLSDGLTGFITWMPATIVIKAITSLFFTSKKETLLCKRNIIALVPSLALCICGYSLFEAIFMIGGFNNAAIAKAFASTPAYCVQIGLSSVLYIAFAKVLDKMQIKKKLGITE